MKAAEYSRVDLYPAFELRAPVLLVTTAGREVFTSSQKLMHALAAIDGDKLRVLQIAEGGHAATAASVAGLNSYLGNFSVRLFRRAQGPGRWVTKYAWSDLKAQLGIEFDDRNVIVAHLPPGTYFGAEISRPVLVANWDGTFASLRGAEL